jgi:hypothetical protein
MKVTFEGGGGCGYGIYVDGQNVGYISSGREKWVTVIDPRDPTGPKKFFSRHKYNSGIGNVKRFVRAILSKMTVLEYLIERETANPQSIESSPLHIAKRCGYVTPLPRMSRDQVARDLGMHVVRGAVSGQKYYE